MSRRKVKLHFMIIGKTSSAFLAATFGNSGVLESVEDEVKNQFGNRPMLVSDKDLVSAEGRVYPKYYAAGWFISQTPLDNTDGEGSELVVVAHGESMAEARANVISAVENSGWESRAENF